MWPRQRQAQVITFILRTVLTGIVKTLLFDASENQFSPVFSLLSSPPIWVFFENSVTGLSQHERGAVTKEVGSNKPFYRLLFPVPIASAAI